MKLLLFILFLHFISFTACKNSKETEPAYNPNECSDYSCMQHRDKMSVTLDNCPECGMKMMNTNLIESYLFYAVQSVQDSIANYHARILGDSYKVKNGEFYSIPEQINYVLEAAKNLNKAKLANENLNRLVFGKHIAIIKPHYKNIEKLYTVASYRLSALRKELVNPNYDNEKVKIYSEELNETIYDIDNEQGLINIKTKRKNIIK